MDDALRRAALAYHEFGRPGKLSVEPTKPMATQRDLALAYSPGVAAACEAIVEDAAWAERVTARGNLVAVITDGTAVLGLGNIGPLASKPVMEGKAVLFKKFAGIDVFDLEVSSANPDHFVEVVAALEPTFGGINLEDIKAPECFYIERALRQRMNIPVFHDDQHGTAIVCAAAVRNALTIQGKQLSEVKLVTSGAGAAALACVDLLVSMGLPADNVTLTDINGVVRKDRGDLTPELARYARDTNAQTLPDVLVGADIFLGLSAPRVLKQEWLPLLAKSPLIMALANPEPEILPELVVASRPDAIVATGRSDYPNQVNNVLCFPFIFRGALDVGATEINEAMKKAAAEAIAELARAEVSDVVASAYAGQVPLFGRDYVIPKPFDPRLILEIAPAVAKAAMDSGVARRPIADFEAYRRELEGYVYRSGQLMRPVFAQARDCKRRIAYAEGEDERVLRGVQTVVDEQLARPVLIGNREIIEAKVRELGLRLTPNRDIEIFDPGADPAVDEISSEYRAVVERRGVPPAAANRRVVTRPTVTAAMLLRRGMVDGALVGGGGDWWRHFTYATPVIPARPGVSRISALSGVIMPKGALFFCDTHVNVDPTAEQIAESTILAAEAVRGFGIAPKVALLSHSSFGSSNSPSARKMRQALALVRQLDPALEVDGEMHGDAALNEQVRTRYISGGAFAGDANLLIAPSLDAANIALTLVSAVTEGIEVGPLLLGLSKPLHVLSPTATARGIVNMTALVASQAAAKV
ncbi:malate dehydrogenase (oxaloacetate-decarboxylating)(NADP+) [Phenylobacterium haematophilum]|uniref:Malate dehydrogenase (Oxaloacetate-decarboxylating)(NADP+) n=1 Tax=Phenylobacterium haematophilum TaxID=98513 RepID=A0A839ZTB2_9CAUL|nr:NADP-dependent malic enzyme [Phenylobacterium haematophilum]MBB3889466.1 malate dehydrogenase (oxaloacetate-decarboxylating)(NADP+) [Phenylobacterium haematophilum]